VYWFCVKRRLVEKVKRFCGQFLVSLLVFSNRQPSCIKRKDSWFGKSWGIRHFSDHPPRFTAEQRADWVRRYERSGLLQQAFVVKHRLRLFTLQKGIAQK